MTALLLNIYIKLNVLLNILLDGDSDVAKVFDIKVANWEDFWEFFARFSFNLIVILLIVRFLYYAHTKSKDYLFTYILISVVTFLLCFTLSNVKLQLGFALGLFAIFGIIRYRTDAIPIKEMTYLFLVIGVSVINALSNKKVSYIELVFANVAVFAVTYVLEYIWLVKHETVKRVDYEKIDLIKPEKRAELIKDLEERTGLKITRVDVGRIDFLRDVARLNIYYYDEDNRTNWANYESTREGDE